MVSDKTSTTELEKGLRDYEMVLVISPKVTDEELETTINNVSKFITGTGGVISSIDKWGKKRLAYPIKYFVEGQYILAKFKLKPSSDKELEANLRITEPIIRHMLIRVSS